jgi:hypothetical protein
LGVEGRFFRDGKLQSKSARRRQERLKLREGFKRRKLPHLLVLAPAMYPRIRTNAAASPREPVDISSFDRNFLGVQHQRIVRNMPRVHHFAKGQRKIDRRFHVARVVLKIHGGHLERILVLSDAASEDHVVQQANRERSQGFSWATLRLIFPSDRDVRGKVIGSLALHVGHGHDE